MIELLRDELTVSGYDACHQRITQLSKDKNSDVRSDVAALLCEYVNPHSEDILLSLLNDRVTLVRIEAADSLSAFPSEKVYYALKKCASIAKDPLLRGYAVMGLGYVTPEKAFTETFEYLENLLSSEKNVFVRIQIYSSKFLLGEYEAVFSLFSVFKKCGYRNRCAILNTLLEFTESGLIKDTRPLSEFLNDVGKFANCLAVKEIYDSLKEALE